MQVRGKGLVVVGALAIVAGVAWMLTGTTRANDVAPYRSLESLLMKFETAPPSNFVRFSAQSVSMPRESIMRIR